MRENDFILDKALDFLFGSINKNGYFPSYTSTERNDFSKSTLCKSIFITANIFDCLKEFNDKKSVEIKTKIYDYLLLQKSSNWSFNYWAKNASENSTMPYPDDLDDTACALSALYSHNPQLFTGEDFAKITSILTHAEVSVGGPYKTWLVQKEDPAVWQDVDLAVNSNIHYFLRLLGVNLPKINNFIFKKVDSNQINSPYYPTIFPIFYFISRGYTGRKKNRIIECLADFRNNKKNLNPLDSSLYLLSMINLGVRDKIMISKEIANIIKHQQQDGSFNAHAFYTGINPNNDKKMHYEGSKELTTAFCVNALLRGKEINKQEEKIIQKTETDKLKSKILQRFKKEFLQFDSCLQKDCHNILNKITRTKIADQILLFPYYFNLSLTKSKISTNEIILLGLANLLGWYAYTIYDDFYDKEETLKLLPIANSNLRKLTCIFCYHLKPKSDFVNIFDSEMDKLENYNYFEITKLNLDSKKTQTNFFNIDTLKISHKSIGHILGPLFILSKNNIYNKEFQIIRDMLLNYIAAKQLNDDAHDWEEDFKIGKITPVTELLINDLAGHDKYDSNFIKKVFWDKTIIKVCSIINEHLIKARDLLKKAHRISNKTYLIDLMAELDNIRISTLNKRQSIIEYISHF